MNQERYDLVGYLSGLLAIIESKEDAGLARGGAIAREYERAYTKLRLLILTEEEKEQK
jgi:hypothetical protein